MGTHAKLTFKKTENGEGRGMGFYMHYDGYPSGFSSRLFRAFNCLDNEALKEKEKENFGFGRLFEKRGILELFLINNVETVELMTEADLDRFGGLEYEYEIDEKNGTVIRSGLTWEIDTLANFGVIEAWVEDIDYRIYQLEFVETLSGVDSWIKAMHGVHADLEAMWENEMVIRVSANIKPYNSYSSTMPRFLSHRIASAYAASIEAYARTFKEDNPNRESYFHQACDAKQGILNFLENDKLRTRFEKLIEKCEGGILKAERKRQALLAQDD